ncbi:MAG: RHS repeat-associated core domain-containing protein, partial [Pseudohongiellaceae bacterium]
EATYFVHNDHLGTPQRITDESQSIVWAGSYEPFGEVEETVANIENNVRFPGQYEDGESKLHYNYFRDYDPTTGRYVESDPIGLNGGINSYEYAIGNPVTIEDYFGLNAFAATQANRMSNPRQGPFGGVCGPEGRPSATWIPDVSPATCREHDECYLNCVADCRGNECKLDCDLELRKRNFPFGFITQILGQSTYDRLKREQGCDNC